MLGFRHKDRPVCQTRPYSAWQEVTICDRQIDQPEASPEELVELEVKGLPGTDSYDLTQVAWKLPVTNEHHVFSVDVSGKTVISSLTEPKSSAFRSCGC
jgi:hypothetical protein